MKVPMLDTKNITFGDIDLIKEDLDLMEYKVDFIIECPRSSETKDGVLPITITGSFRPHIQGIELGFSEFELNQYIWHRIIKHTEKLINIHSATVSTLRLRTRDIDKNKAKNFKESTLPNLPDYSMRENRKIDGWLSDVIESP